MATKKKRKAKSSGCGCSSGLGKILGRPTADGRLRRIVTEDDNTRSRLVRKIGDDKAGYCITGYDIVRGRKATIGCFRSKKAAVEAHISMSDEIRRSSSPLFADLKVGPKAAVPWRVYGRRDGWVED